MRWRPAWLAWGLWALAMLGLTVLVWVDQLLRQTGRPELIVLTPTAPRRCWGPWPWPRSGRWWPAAGPGTRSVGC